MWERLSLWQILVRNDLKEKKIYFGSWLQSGVLGLTALGIRWWVSWKRACGQREICPSKMDLAKSHLLIAHWWSLHPHPSTFQWRDGNLWQMSLCRMLHIQTLTNRRGNYCLDEEVQEGEQERHLPVEWGKVCKGDTGTSLKTSRKDNWKTPWTILSNSETRA